LENLQKSSVTKPVRRILDCESGDFTPQDQQSNQFWRINMTRLYTSAVAILTLVTLFSVDNTNQAVAQQSQNPYYFGMDIQLVRDSFGRPIVQVFSVTPNGPAHLAGLERGDQILNVNGQDFSQATDSFEAVRMMNYYVQLGGGSIAPASPVAPATSLFVDPGTSQPTAQMSVRDVRTGRTVYVTLYPKPNCTSPGYPDIAPAAASEFQTQNQPPRPWNR
jgi:membrane-associated protease RseP (regulator of RpoE activity)